MSKKLYKRVNLGFKREPIEATTKKSNDIIYPTLYISHSKLPFKGEDVGKSFTCNVIMELVGIREEDRKGNKNNYNYDFEVKDITFIGK